MQSFIDQNVFMQCLTVERNGTFRAKKQEVWCPHFHIKSGFGVREKSQLHSLKT